MQSRGTRKGERRKRRQINPPPHSPLQSERRPGDALVARSPSSSPPSGVASKMHFPPLSMHCGVGGGSEGDADFGSCVRRRLRMHTTTSPRPSDIFNPPPPPTPPHQKRPTPFRSLGVRGDYARFIREPDSPSFPPPKPLAYTTTQCALLFQ